MMDYSCGNCGHCVDRHGEYRNDGVCLLLGISVKKSNNCRGSRRCGIKLNTEEGRYIPARFVERERVMKAKEPHNICTVCGGSLVYEKNDMFSNHVRVCYAEDEKEPRIAMTCQDCGLRYAIKRGDA